MSAKDALFALRRQIRGEHEEVCRHLHEVQLRFLHSKPLINLATGYTGCDTTFEREMDLSGLVHAPIETDPWLVDEAEEYGSSQGRILGRVRIPPGPRVRFKTFQRPG